MDAVPIGILKERLNVKWINMYIQRIDKKSVTLIVYIIFIKCCSRFLLPKISKRYYINQFWIINSCIKILSSAINIFERLK